jgi:hypothetical protein
VLASVADTFRHVTGLTTRSQHRRGQSTMSCRRSAIHPARSSREAFASAWILAELFLMNPS